MRLWCLFGVAVAMSCVHVPVSAPAPNQLVDYSCPTRVPAFVGVDAEAFSGEGATIAQVCLVGASPQFAELASHIGSRKGARLEAERVASDIQELFSSALLSDIRVLALPVAGEVDVVTLVYVVKEYDRLIEVEAVGDTIGKSRAEIASSFLMARFEDWPLSPVLLNEFVALHRQQAEEVGYPAAKVSAEIEPIGNGSVRVRLHVDTGPQLIVGGIRFEGVGEIPESELRQAITTEVGKPYVHERFKQDAARIGSLYHDRGMVHAGVNLVTSESAGVSGRLVAVSFVIRKGEVFRVGAVKIVDPFMLTESAAPVALETRTNQLYSRNGVVRDVELLKSLGRMKGVEVEVTPEPSVDPSRKMINFVFHIDKKPQ